MDKLNRGLNQYRLKFRENSSGEMYSVKQRRLHRKATTRASESPNKIRDSVMKPKKLKQIEELEAQAAVEICPKDKQEALTLKQMRKNPRYTSNHTSWNRRSEQHPNV
jgi:hypothetical protein